MNKELNRLYRKLWITKGCRFIASKRLEKHNHYSNLTITIISVYIIALNLSILLENRPSILSDSNITYVTICASILVLAISLIVNSKNYQGLSGKFHDCGREITEVYDQICLLKAKDTPPTSDDLKGIVHEYQEIIRKYDINQNDLDYDLFKCQNLNDFNNILDNDTKNQVFLKQFKSKIFWVRTKIKFFFHQYFLYFLFLVSPLIFIFLI